MAISTIDLVAPFDPTAYTSITGAQLLQLVSGLTPFTGVGFQIATMDIAGIPQVPNAAVTTKWQNYSWLRVSATYVTLYIWNPNGATDPTFLNWVTVSSASIGPGTIQGYQIAANTIAATNIISISSAQITGSVVPAWLAQLNLAQTAYATNGLMNNNSLIFGDLAGVGSTVAQPVIAPLAVTQGKIALQAVAGNPVALTGQIKDNSITTLQLLSNGNTPSTPYLSAAVDPAINILLPTKSVIGIPGSGSSTQNSQAGDFIGVAYNKTGFVLINRAILNLADPAAQTYPQLLAVQPSATTYSLIDGQGANSGAPIGRILQVKILPFLDKISSSGTISTSGTPVYNATGNNLANSTTGITFTPLSASSTLLIEFKLLTYLNASAYYFAGLYTAQATAAPVIFSAIVNTSGGSLEAIQAAGILASPGTSAINIYVTIGTSSGTAYTNSIDGSTSIFGGISSYVKITEYI